MSETAAARLAEAAVATFLVACFAVPTEAAYALVFYLTVLPAIPVLLCRRRPAMHSAAWFALALIAWSALTLIWGEDPRHRAGAFALGALCTSVWLAALLLLLPSPGPRRRLARLLVAAGGANAVFCIARHLWLSPRDPRLHGWGIDTHPILGAAVMAVVGLTALWIALSGDGGGEGEGGGESKGEGEGEGESKSKSKSNSETRRWRAGSLAVACIAALYLLLTDSRGPLLAACMAAIVLCASGPWRRRALPVLPLPVLAWLALRPVVAWLRRASGHVARGAITVPPRGDSHRPEIWEHSWRLIEQRPLAGHGLAANIDLPKYTFPHDLYLGLLFYSGAIGAALFAGTVLCCVRRQCAPPEGVAQPFAAWPLLLALGLNGLINGLTDLGQITKGPGPLWLILWLPLGLAMTARTKSRNVLF